MRKSVGFTIVELLIVIVVIGILAAITIVAYNGIQSKASEAAARSDLANFAKKFELYKVEPGTYPADLAALESLGLKATKSAYDTSVALNLMVCRNTPLPASSYVILATTKSGKRLYVTNSSGGIQEYTGAQSWSGTDSAGICTSVLASSVVIGAGYRADDTTTGPWRSWAGGN